MQSFHSIWHHTNKGDYYWMDIESDIKQALNGDRQAITRLYNAYSHKVLGICYNIVGNRVVAEELAHDAFVLAFSKLDNLRNPKRFDAWLSSIAFNVALRHKQRNHELDTIPVDDIPDDTWNEEEPKDMPSMDEIMAAVNALPNGYGKVFKMSVMQDMSHKEIGDILGIAAHSSSSQLARAKKMLQHSLAKYWTVVLLTLLSPFALWLLRTPKTENEEKPIISKQEKPDTSQEHAQSPQSNEPSKKRRPITTTAPENYTKKDVSTTDSISNNTEEPVTENDDTTTTPIKKTLPHLRLNDDIHFAQDHHSSIFKSQKESIKRWSADLAYTGQPTPESDLMTPYNFTVIDYIAPSVPGEPDPTLTINNWSDYIAYLDECSQIISTIDEKDRIMRRIAMSNEPLNNGQIMRKTHHSLPISYSLSLRYQVNKRIGLESGLQYTRLNSLFQTGEGINRIDEKQRIDYLGVPLKVSYQIWSSNYVGIYSSAGMTLEIPVRSTVTSDYILKNQPELRDSHHLEVPLQWSTGVGVGVQYNITPSISIFAEPGVQYYIPDGSGIETYRTQHPFTITIPAGLRFTW